MILFNIADIRLFWSQDPRFLQQFEAGKVTKFKPFSKYPACWRDISFWIGDKPFHLNDMCDIVRDVAGNVAEEIAEASVKANWMGVMPWLILCTSRWISLLILRPTVKV